MKGPLCYLPKNAARPPHLCLQPPHAQCALQLLRHGGITPVGKLKSLLESQPDVFLVRCIGPGGCSPCLTASAQVFVRPTCGMPLAAVLLRSAPIQRHVHLRGSRRSFVNDWVAYMYFASLYTGFLDVGHATAM